MDSLYSPWRMEYILSEKEKGCIFCKKPQVEEDKKNFILKRGKYSYVIMNLYPYNNGHLMVVPYRHIADYAELEDNELQEITKLLGMSENVLKEAYKPQGFNIGINIGEAAGAGIEEHLHVHIVPRWQGDTNFISTIGKTRVIPEKMEKAYKKLKLLFDNEKI